MTAHNPLTQPQLPWLSAGEPFPPPSTAWGPLTPAPGLLAAGGALDVDTLMAAYALGVFPWFSQGQPILWWSTDPRMVLPVAEFKLHRSLTQSIKRFVADTACEIRVDYDFPAVIKACSNAPRDGQSGTWIVPEMVSAYTALHRAGFAHSVETWVNGDLLGGLYCVNLGCAVFGESMFSRATDASKLALAALVGFCKSSGVQLIDCQQNTAHLASLGAREMPRSDFCAHVAQAQGLPAPLWRFDKHILASASQS
jgi:leucyl/phenylalanyl-tRNA---protein transferase